MVLYRCVALQQFVSSDWLVQARFAHVDVAVLGEGREQGEEGLWVHVVIIVHMTKPPEEPQREEQTNDAVTCITLVFVLIVWVSRLLAIPPVDVSTEANQPEH